MCACHIENIFKNSFHFMILPIFCKFCRMNLFRSRKHWLQVSTKIFFLLKDVFWWDYHFQTIIILVEECGPLHFQGKPIRIWENLANFRFLSIYERNCDIIMTSLKIDFCEKLPYGYLITSKVKISDKCLHNNSVLNYTKF